MKKIHKGTPVAPGIAFGRACFYEEKKTERVYYQKYTPAVSSKLLYDAFYKLTEQLNAMAGQAEICLDQSAAGIFHAQVMICEEVQEDIQKIIQNKHLNVKEAIEECFDSYVGYFSGLRDSYLSQRSSDFTELKQLLLNHLDSGVSGKNYPVQDGCGIDISEMETEHVLITSELTASKAIRIGNLTKGVIAEKCGSESHAAVIARALGIPVVSGIRDPCRLVTLEDSILINGNDGKIIINPGKVVLSRYRPQINNPNKPYEVVEPVPQFRVFADIERSHDVKNVIMANADGIGLYRTEFEILGKDHLLSETEQIECYQYVIKQMNGKPVYIRLFDLGNDKSAPWLQFVSEENTRPGCRGARFLLSHPELLRTQARAIAKASCTSDVNVIYPMICNLDQFIKLKSIFMEAVSKIAHGPIQHGIMFEVPSACVLADDLYKVIDFGRIGSNDLVQYLFAYDRAYDDFNYNELIHDPALWKIIAGVANAAREARKPIELCGAMADKPEFIANLLELGITSISTRPENVSIARKTANYCLNSNSQLCLL